MIKSISLGLCLMLAGNSLLFAAPDVKVLKEYQRVSKQQIVKMGDGEPVIVVSIMVLAGLYTVWGLLTDDAPGMGTFESSEPRHRPSNPTKAIDDLEVAKAHGRRLVKNMEAGGQQLNALENITAADKAAYKAIMTDFATYMQESGSRSGAAYLERVLQYTEDYMPQSSASSIRAMKGILREFLIKSSLTIAGLVAVSVFAASANEQYADRILKNPDLFLNATEEELEKIAANDDAANACETIYKVTDKLSKMPKAERETLMKRAGTAEKSKRQIQEKKSLNHELKKVFAK